MWIQDFPFSVAPTPARPLPTPNSDPEQLRHTLHCFYLALFRAVRPRFLACVHVWV